MISAQFHQKLSNLIATLEMLEKKPRLLVNSQQVDSCLTFVKQADILWRVSATLTAMALEVYIIK
jgi:hypothetical protein